MSTRADAFDQGAPVPPGAPSPPADGRLRPVWDRPALVDPHRVPDKSRRVAAMFDAIAHTYERVNTVSTFGRDAAWRRAAVAAAEIKGGEVVLDLCCGTGDMLRAFAAHDPPPSRIIGVDFSPGMLRAVRCGQSEARVPIQLVRADAQCLPLRSASVDTLTCAFGVRNFERLAVGLSEFTRVLRPGGRAVVLEFTTPRNFLMRWGYEMYCDRVLPWLGRWISGDRTGAYNYLPRSIRTFLSPEALADALCRVGMRSVQVRRLHFGGVVLLRAER